MSYYHNFMKKILPVLIISLFLCFNFCFAEPLDPGSTFGIPGFSDVGTIPALLLSGQGVMDGSWSLEVTDASIPTNIKGFEKINIRVRVKSAKLDKNIPAIVVATQKDLSATEYTAISKYEICEPSPVYDYISLAPKVDYYQGTCDITLSGTIGSKDQDKIELAIVLYKGDAEHGLMGANTTMVQKKTYTINVLPSSTSGGDSGATENLGALKWESIVDFANHVINIIFGIIVSFAFIAIVIGGILMVTSAGDPTRVAKARNTIFFALAGFAIASLSKGIVSLIQAIMGVKEKSG